MNLVINKVKMPPYLLGFGRGHGWELKDLDKKIIADVFPTKKQAEDLAKSLKILSNYKPDGLGRSGSDSNIIHLLPLKDRYKNLF